MAKMIGEKKKIHDMRPGEVFVAMGGHLTRRSTKNKKLAKAIPYLNGHIFTESKNTQIFLKFHPKQEFEIVGFVHGSDVYKEHRSKAKR